MLDLATPTASIPEPRRYPLLGNIPELNTEAFIQSLMDVARELGPIFRLTTPAGSSLFVSSRELAADACDEQRFDKHVHGALENIRDFTGDGLFTARTGEANWGKAHRLLLPAFGPLAMRDYFDDMLDIADQMLTKWERLGPGALIDVPDAMTRLTLDTIALSGFGYRFNSFYQREMHPFVEAMVRALHEAGARNNRLSLQNWLMPWTRQQYKADIGTIHGITDELIARRRALDPAQAPRDLLGLMLTAADPLTGERLDDANIRHQLVTFLIAGHETTSGLLSFALYLLLNNPAALAKARAQIDETLGDRMPRFEDLARLGYVEQLLRETLRLYPTAPAFAVAAKRDTMLGGRYPLKQGDAVFILAPMLHRDPAVWADPERFDPERWAPGNEPSIPSHAWLPFGSGQRSCIGRGFALQEATLVLAMLLQRFEISTPQPYALRIKETLTLKPEGFAIQARARTAIRRAAPEAPAPRPASQPTAASHATPFLALYGSNSGTAEAFARRLAGDAAGKGYAAAAAPLDEFAGKLPAAGAVAIVTASYNGQPPDNARSFCAWLAAAAPDELAGVRYAVFGCGSRDWAATYQAVPARIDERLLAAGAQPLLPRGAGDARGDLWGDFERWQASFQPALDQALGVEPATGGAAGPLYAIEIAASPAAELARQHRLDFARVLENRELVDCSSPLGRSKRHLALRLPAGSSYQAGDYLAVLPENHPSLVERAARRFGLRLDATVLLRSERGALAALPVDQPMALQELLGRYVELSTPASAADLAALAAANPCPPHRAELAALAAPERHRAEILERRVSVLELLERYPSCDLPFGAFLGLLPALRVRQYSISSSPLADPTACSLTVAVVSAPAWSGQGRFYGAASSYLAQLQPGDQVAVAVRRPGQPFAPPADNRAPLVMIAAGTGLAPFRGFIEERALRAERGEAAGPALLFFGCDHPKVDFLYRKELERWERAGGVRIFPAYSHQQEGEVRFVQHRLWRERALVLELIEAGAAIFLCGDGLRMAPAVRATLAEIWQEARGCSAGEAAAWLGEMERAGRFAADVFGA